MEQHSLSTHSFTYYSELMFEFQILYEAHATEQDDVLSLECS